MSQEDVDTIRRLYDAAARRDTETVLSLYDPDVEWDGTRHRWVEVLGSTGAKLHGHEGLREWARAYYEVWEELEETLDELIDAGEYVISVVSTRARGRASGAEVDMKASAGVWTVRDGRVVRVVWFRSRAEALEAAGLGAGGSPNE